MQPCGEEERYTACVKSASRLAVVAKLRHAVLAAIWLRSTFENIASASLNRHSRERIKIFFLVGTEGGGAFELMKLKISDAFRCGVSRDLQGWQGWGYHQHHEESDKTLSGRIKVPANQKSTDALNFCRDLFPLKSLKKMTKVVASKILLTAKSEGADTSTRTMFLCP